MHICYVVLLMLVPSCMSWPFVKIILKICSVYFSHKMLEFWIILFCYYVWNNDDFFLFWSFMVGVKEEWTIIHWKTSCLSTWWVIIVALCFFFFFALICLDMHEYILAMSILQVLLLGINSSLEMIWWLQVSVDIGWMELITYASFVANWFASTFLFIWIARNTFSCFLYDTHLIFIALVCWIHFSCARKSYIVKRGILAVLILIRDMKPPPLFLGTSSPNNQLFSF
jgi:hypothetical protein